MAVLENYQPQPELQVIRPEVQVPSYVLKLDRNNYQEADTLRFNNPEKYFQTLEKLNAYTEFQMRTNIGERLNVLQSTYRFDINEGQMYGENTDEPFVNMIKRGRDYRRQHGNPQDFAREDAEVIGFEKIQNTLLNPNTQVGTTTLTFSPPGGEGSIYQHNFYDTHTLKVDENGNKYVEAKRFSSALTPQEILTAARSLDSNFPTPLNEEDDVFLLKHNIVLEEDPEEIHKFLHQEHIYLSTEDFELIIDACTPYIKEYINYLASNPYDEEGQGVRYNSILNVADETVRLIQAKRDNKEVPLISLKNITIDDVYYYGSQEVRQLDVGCGFSGGYELGMGLYGGQANPFSVVEFASTKEKPWNYHRGNCVSCRKKGIDVGPCKICKDCEKKFD